MNNKIYIGTSGWQYKHWKGTFYPDDVKIKDHFIYYQKFFDTVEINNSFYRVPPKETFIKWREKTNDDFIYVVKANRYITHLKKLKDCEKALQDFINNASGLQKKLGAILFQLPPGWKIDTERFENFLKELPKGLRCIFEFRNETWYNEQIYSLLEKYNFAFCIYQLAGHTSPLKVTADFVYIRLHGPGGKYQGNYTEQDLSHWAQQCREWLNEHKDIYVYFDNDEKGYAAFNAIRLKELMEAC